MADDTTGASRRRRGRGTVVAAVAGWLVVVVAVSALAWLAIGSAGSEVLDPSAQQVPSDYTGAAPLPGSSTTTAPPSPTGHHPTPDVVRRHGADHPEPGGHGLPGRRRTGRVQVHRRPDRPERRLARRRVVGEELDVGRRLAAAGRVRVRLAAHPGGGHLLRRSSGGVGGGRLQRRRWQTGAGAAAAAAGTTTEPVRPRAGAAVRWPHDGGPAPACREEPRCATC